MSGVLRCVAFCLVCGCGFWCRCTTSLSSVALPNLILNTHLTKASDAQQLHELAGRTHVLLHPLTRACMHADCLSAAMQGGRTTPGRPGASSPAGGKWQVLTTEVGGAMLNVAPIDCFTPYAFVYMCMNSCLATLCRLVALRLADQGEFLSRRQVASSHAQGQACAIFQRRTHRWLYALRIHLRVCLYSSRGPTVQVGRTTPGQPGCKFPSRRQVAISHARGGRLRFPNAARTVATRLLHPFTCACILALAPQCMSVAPRPADQGASSQPATSGDLSRPGRVRFLNTARMCSSTPYASV